MSLEMPENQKTDTAVSEIPYVGPALKLCLERLRIKTVEGLFNFLPKDVIDLSPTPIAKIASLGEKIAIRGSVANIKTIKTPRRRIFLTCGEIHDETGSIEAVWFNQPYLRNFFNPEAKYVFYGQVDHDKTGRHVVMMSPVIYPSADLVVRYPLTKGITSRQMSRVVKSAREKFPPVEFMPPEVLKSFNLPEIAEAIDLAHFPKTEQEFKTGRHRFVFNSLLNFILANFYQQQQNLTSNACKINSDHKFLEKFIASLPFKLTADQQNAVNEIAADLSGAHPMNRLVQGDVGSGKTIVALCGALLAVRAGYQVAWLAPTEILAQQHFETVKKFIEKYDISISLLTSSTKKLQTTADKLQTNIVIGTHALLQPGIKFKDLGLVIVDEQHRFGVEQRGAFEKTVGSQLSVASSKSIKDYKQQTTAYKPSPPHFLSLSATPIPRTLAHVVFGNLDISIISTMPSGRKPIKTFLIPEEKRTGSYKFIDDLIQKGQQVFVICPLIETPNSDNEIFEDEQERKSVKAEVDNLKKTILKKRRIEFLHGRMKSSDKNKIMARMQKGEIDILVSTSVVEVGVDVKNASVMVIEDAEHFGLSQLHQFRGRVGRSNLQSYCFLFNKEAMTEKTRERLKTFVQNLDGFKLAEMDLKQRGPGAILGLEQSGFRGINPLWFENSKFLSDISETAKKLVLKLDALPLLKSKVLKLLDTEHLE